MSGLQGDARLKAGSWVKMLLHSSLGKEVEVVMMRGEPVYGRLVAFSLDTKPCILVVATNNSKVFINLEKVERIRVAEESR